MSAFSRFTPDPHSPIRGIGLCGLGEANQYNMQLTSNPTFVLLTASEPGAADHDPALVKLAAETNKFFQEKAEKVILNRRNEVGISRLELTIRLAPEGFRLVYAWPHPQGKRAPTPQWVLGGRFWLWLSRVVYPLLHWRKPRIPASAYDGESAPKKGGKKSRAA